MGLRLCDRCGYVCLPHGDPDANGVGGTECRCPTGACSFCTAHHRAASEAIRVVHSTTDASTEVAERLSAMELIVNELNRLRALSKDGLGPDGEVIL